MATTGKAFVWKAAISGLAVCAVAAAILSVAQAQNVQAQNAEGGNGNGLGISLLQWPMGGQDIFNSRNQLITGINPSNVASLKLQWRFQTGGDVSATPAVVFNSSLRANVVYFPDFAGNFYAVNGTTGKQIWTQNVQTWTGVTGDYARDDPTVITLNGQPTIILGDQAGALATYTGGALQGSGAYVMAVNATTGNLIWKTQVEIFPGAVITSSPVVYNNTVYVGVAGLEEGTAATPGYPCCVSRGSVVALNATTGAKLWQTYMVPNNQGLTGGYSGGAVWGSTPVIDPLRNSVYVGTGNNYSVPSSVAACITATPMNAACTDPTDYFDSIVALDMGTGKVKWADRAMYYDAWNVACFFNAPGTGNCPNPAGPDYDFGGAGPNLFVTSKGQQLVGAGEKSGIYYAVNPDTGAIVWSTNVGPGSALGGIEWGTAFDFTNVYVPIVNDFSIPYALQPSGTKVNSGSWAALDPATGAIKWQTATPGACSGAPPQGYAQGCIALGPVSAAGGVMFGSSMDKTATNPTMFALNGKTGAILWSYAAGGTVNAGPAIVGNWVYWGSGYSHLGLGTSNPYLFAFSVPAN